MRKKVNTVRDDGEMVWNRIEQTMIGFMFQLGTWRIWSF